VQVPFPRNKNTLHLHHEYQWVNAVYRNNWHWLWPAQGTHPWMLCMDRMNSFLKLLLVTHTTVHYFNWQLVSLHHSELLALSAGSRTFAAIPICCESGSRRFS